MRHAGFPSHDLVVQADLCLGGERSGTRGHAASRSRSTGRRVSPPRNRTDQVPAVRSRQAPTPPQSSRVAPFRREPPYSAGPLPAPHRPPWTPGHGPGPTALKPPETALAKSWPIYGIVPLGTLRRRPLLAGWSLKSRGLIIPWSQVRVLVGPPPPLAARGQFFASAGDVARPSRPRRRLPWDTDPARIRRTRLLRPASF